MASQEVIERLEKRASTAEKMIHLLSNQLSDLQQVSLQSKKDDLRKENKELTAQVEALKMKLIEAETKSGVKQYYDFTKNVSAEPVAQNQNGSVQKESSPKPQAAPVEKSADKNKDSKPKKEKKEKGGGGGGGKKPEVPEAPVDVARLDFRVGKIVTAKKHPDADSLYVEEVDVGEGKMRTVVSGLVRFIPEEEMQNRMAVLLCNLKPAKMRGVTSEAMVMCASTPEKVEILSPPEGCVPGDLLEFEGYTRNPDPVLNPKKKVFETCAPDLKTDGNRIACYKGIPFTVPGKGTVAAQTLTNVQVK